MKSAVLSVAKPCQLLYGSEIAQYKCYKQATFLRNNYM